MRRGGDAVSTVDRTPRSSTSAHFTLPPELEATEPPELTLGRRDAVRMLVSIGDEPPRPSTARDLSTWLRRGRPRRRQHVGDDPGRHRRHDARRASRRRPPVDRAADRPPPRRGAPSRSHGSTPPDPDDHAGEVLALAGGGSVRLLGRMPGSVRLWVATLDLPDAAARAPVPLRAPDPLRLRAGLVADHGLHERLRP